MNQQFWEEKGRNQDRLIPETILINTLGRNQDRSQYMAGVKPA